MAINVKLTDVSCALWDAHRHEFQKHTGPGSNFNSAVYKGILVSWDIEAAFYGYAPNGKPSRYKQTNERLTLDLLFCRYTSVFMRTRGIVNVPLEFGWSLIASHDSAWRDIQSDISQVEADLAKRVGGHLPKSWKGVALSWFVAPAYFPFFTATWVTLEAPSKIVGVSPIITTT